MSAMNIQKDLQYKQLSKGKILKSHPKCKNMPYYALFQGIYQLSYC